MAVTLSSLEPFNGSRVKHVDEQKLCIKGVVNKTRFKANIKNESETTKTSSVQQTQVGYQYPPVPLPKAWNKGSQALDEQRNVCHMDDK